MRAGELRTSAFGESTLMSAALVILFAGAAVCLRPALLPTVRERSIDRILPLLQNRHPAALEFALQHIREFPNDPFGIALGADAAASQGDQRQAIGLYQQLPTDAGRWESHAELGQAKRCEILGDLEAAEKHLQRVLELNPQHLEAHSRLGHLLQIESRTAESGPHFFALIQRGRCRGDELMGMALTERFFRLDDRLEQLALAASPPQVLIRLSRARRLAFDNRMAEAEDLLRQIVAQRPDSGEAQGRLGRIIVERGNANEFQQWQAHIPTAARSHPEVWFVQGLQARRQGDLHGAVACFLEVLDAAPNHLGANVQIAGCLERIGLVDPARGFVDRGRILAELESVFNLMRADSNPDLMSRAIVMLGRLGRYWEAAGWCLVLTRLEFPAARSQARRDLPRWERLARSTGVQNAPEMLPSRILNRTEFALPRWSVPESATDHESVAASQIPFWDLADDAERVGIRFEYYEGTDEQQRLQHIFNVMGGGCGALDFDRDGWPDLYVAQAHAWRNPAPQPQYSDRLYRNLDGAQFSEVSQPAGIEELGFSHGVAAGDFDQDGFADVYIGNKGPNRLFRNNGDGTFTDATIAAGVAGNEWTTSSVFADFNRDGLPDLYVLNYTPVDATAEKLCWRNTGEEVACTPDVLPPEDDRLYLNVGDGSFRDVSAAAGILLPDGRGLGVVVWDYAGDGRLGLFVANDTSANFFLVNESTDAAGVPHFRDEGIVRGVAFDLDGNAQASMGVAAGDANGDGFIDLFVTNFFGDSNTLYAQRPDRFFDDLTRPFALRDPSFWMLGFGCQFADFDLDGWQDLIATNGHVDQHSTRGDPDRMPPQVFRNLAGRRFTEVPADHLGPFFQRGYLGRGLATLDWNRDGRTDVGISHLHAPFALLTNRTPAVHSPLGIRLLGRQGCREPIGATVRLKSGDREQVRFLTAGDGFLVTNERMLQFAVPRTEPGVRIDVQWPGGAVERWEDVPAGREVLLIEGQSRPVVLRTYPAD